MFSLSSVFGFNKNPASPTPVTPNLESNDLNSIEENSPQVDHGEMAGGVFSPTSTINMNTSDNNIDNSPISIPPKQSLFSSLINIFNINTNTSLHSSHPHLHSDSHSIASDREDALSVDCYQLNENENVDNEVAANILALSVSDCEALVGWQIELFRNSKKNHSLGIFVIIEAKKRKIQPVKYLLISKGGHSGAREILRWTVLKRAANEEGKPFRLLRKVRDFSDDDDEDEDSESDLESHSDNDSDVYITGDGRDNRNGYENRGNELEQDEAAEEEGEDENNYYY